MDEPVPDNRVPIAPGVLLPASALRFTFSRSGGPGGQNVNKLSTKATIQVADLADAMPPWALKRLLIHAGSRLAGDGEREPPGDREGPGDREESGGREESDDLEETGGRGDRIIITDSSSRSQQSNKQACLAKLRMMVVEAMNRPKRRRATKPSRASIQRRLDAKKHRSRRLQERRKPTDS